MRILALTSIRSEYDLMSSLFFKLHYDNDIDLKLLVGGAHNSSSFGLTVEDIKSDGFNILQVESLIDGDTSSSRLKSASLLLMSSIDIVKGYAPDLIIYAGDREDVLIGSLLGGYLAVPTIHFFGGDHACDGHIDNPVRHATSKLSTYHFVSTEEHKKRLMSIGEPEFRIRNIGSVALDKFSEIESNPAILNQVAETKVVKNAALLIFHPMEEELAVSHEIVTNTVRSLISEGFHVFIGKPNTDLGNSLIRKEIGKLSHLDDVTVYGNLPRKEFVQLFKACDLIIGNSSAGLLEAASIPIPCINIGLRQKGRYCGENVQFVEATLPDISSAIQRVKSTSYQQKISKVLNPYGDGKASQKAYALIKSTDFNLSQKKKEDPLYCDK